MLISLLLLVCCIAAGIDPVVSLCPLLLVSNKFCRNYGLPVNKLLTQLFVRVMPVSPLPTFSST